MERSWITTYIQQLRLRQRFRSHASDHARCSKYLHRRTQIVRRTKNHQVIETYAAALAVNGVGVLASTPFRTADLRIESRRSASVIHVRPAEAARPTCSPSLESRRGEKVATSSPAAGTNSFCKRWRWIGFL